MDTEADSENSNRATEAIRALVRQMLGEGITPIDITFALTFVGLDLALQTAPSPAHALSLVTTALSHAAHAHWPKDADAAETVPAGTAAEDVRSVTSGPRILH